MTPQPSLFDGSADDKPTPPPKPPRRPQARTRAVGGCWCDQHTRPGDDWFATLRTPRPEGA